MWQQGPTVDNWGNQIFDSEEKLTVSKKKIIIIISGSTGYTMLNVLTLDVSIFIDSSKLKYQ